MIFSPISSQTAALKAVSASWQNADDFSSKAIPAFFLAVSSSGVAIRQVHEQRQTMLTSWPWKSRPAGAFAGVRSEER